MAAPTFLIREGSTDFLNKQKNLLDLLESAEKEKNVVDTAQDDLMELDEEVKSRKRKRKETKQYRGKESLFKAPMDLPPRFRRQPKIPDFQRNPHKWVKYSLADITQDDMSNESNTAAALSFLRDIKRQKKIAEVKMEVEEPERKPVQSSLHQFSQPIKQESKPSHEPVIDTERDSDKAVFKSSKLIMPEYVVGQVKKEIKPAKKKIPKEAVKEVYLNHIHEYDDE